jgi:amidase
MKPLHALTLTEAASALARGALTATAYAEALLARTAATDPAIGAWVDVDAQHVRSEAARCDAMPEARRGPLHGIPVGLKDIIATTALPTRMGSPVFADHAAADAACVQRLLAAGGYAFGKTVTAELAFLQPGPTRNPWNAGYTPGGSSQGSAAAVAAGHVPAALGTQTNGSVIRPAAFCGVVGFKPTVGALPFAGVHVFSETLDTLGTFTRSVADAACLASVLADPGAIAATPQPLAHAPRLALLTGFPWASVAADADVALDAAATRLRAAGAEVAVVALPDVLGDTARVLRTIMLHEAARNLGSLQDRERPRLSAVLNAALDEGRAIAAPAYAHAVASRRTMIAAATDWLARYDALLAPPTTGTAPEGLASTGDPGCCTLASLLGAPAVTLPVARAANGLPLGLQLVGVPGGDDHLLAVAAWCEPRLPFAGLA